MAVQLERLADRQHHPPRDPLGFGCAGNIGEQKREFVAGEAGKERSRGAAGRFAVDEHAQAVRDHDQQLVAAGMAEVVVDRLEAVEVDEQHRGGAALGFASRPLGLGAEVEAIGQAGDRIVHAQRLGIVDRVAHFGEQAVHRRRHLGHDPAHRFGRRAGEIAFFDRQQAIAKRRQCARAFAVGPFGSDIADHQAEGAGDHRRGDLLRQLGDGDEGVEREDERRDAGQPRQEHVADLVRGADLHHRCIVKDAELRSGLA